MQNESQLFYCTLCRSVWGLYFFPNGTEWELHSGIPSYGKMRKVCPQCKGYVKSKITATKKQILEEDVYESIDD